MRARSLLIRGRRSDGLQEMREQFLTLPETKAAEDMLIAAASSSSASASASPSTSPLSLRPHGAADALQRPLDIFAAVPDPRYVAVAHEAMARVHRWRGALTLQEASLETALEAAMAAAAAADGETKDALERSLLRLHGALALARLRRGPAAAGGDTGAGVARDYHARCALELARKVGGAGEQGVCSLMLTMLDAQEGPLLGGWPHENDAGDNGAAGGAAAALASDLADTTRRWETLRWGLGGGGDGSGSSSATGSATKSEAEEDVGGAPPAPALPEGVRGWTSTLHAAAALNGALEHGGASAGGQQQEGGSEGGAEGSKKDPMDTVGHRNRVEAALTEAIGIGCTSRAAWGRAAPIRMLSSHYAIGRGDGIIAEGLITGAWVGGLVGWWGRRVLLEG